MIFEQIDDLRNGLLRENIKPRYLHLGRKEWTIFQSTCAQLHFRPMTFEDYMTTYLDLEIIKADREHFLHVS